VSQERYVKLTLHIRPEVATSAQAQAEARDSDYHDVLRGALTASLGSGEYDPEPPPCTVPYDDADAFRNWLIGSKSYQPNSASTTASVARKAQKGEGLSDAWAEAGTDAKARGKRRRIVILWREWTAAVAAG